MASTFQYGILPDKQTQIYNSIPLADYPNEGLGDGHDPRYSGALSSLPDYASERSMLKSNGTDFPSGNQSNTASRMWNPIWLSRGVLLGFAAWFAALFVTLIALYVYSVKNGGLV